MSQIENSQQHLHTQMSSFFNNLQDQCQNFLQNFDNNMQQAFQTLPKICKQLSIIQLQTIPFTNKFQSNIQLNNLNSIPKTAVSNDVAFVLQQAKHSIENKIITEVPQIQKRRRRRRKQKKVEDPNNPRKKRGLTPFIRFFMMQVPVYKAMGVKSKAEVAKRVGAEWNSMTPGQKNEFIEKCKIEDQKKLQQEQESKINVMEFESDQLKKVRENENDIVSDYDEF